MMFPRVVQPTVASFSNRSSVSFDIFQVGLLLESQVSVLRFMQAFDDGLEAAKLSDSRLQAAALGLITSSSAAAASSSSAAASSSSSAAAAAVPAVFGCPSRSCALEGAECVMLQVCYHVVMCDV
jgi:hypothetical protein